MCSLLLRFWLPCKHFWNLAAQMVRWWSAARLYIDYLTCCISLHITRLLKVHFILHCGSGSSFFSLTFYHNHFMDMFLFYNPMETFLQNITLTVSRFVHLAANTFHFEMGKLKLQSIVKLNYLRSNFCFITGSQIIIIQVASFSFSICLGSANPPPPKKKPNIVRHMNLSPQRSPILVKFTWDIPCAAASLNIWTLCLWQCKWLFWSMPLDWKKVVCSWICLFWHWLIYLQQSLPVFPLTTQKKPTKIFHIMSPTIT